jgi:hypothetical protein
VLLLNCDHRHGEYRKYSWNVLATPYQLASDKKSKSGNGMKEEDNEIPTKLVGYLFISPGKSKTVSAAMKGGL